MTQSTYTPRQQAFIAALAIPFVENTSVAVFNPSIPLVDQDSLVPDWIEMGIITEDSPKVDVQALILKGADACVAAFESADPVSREGAVFAALHQWADQDLQDPDFKKDSKYHEVGYALKSACQEQVPVSLAVTANGSEEWLDPGIMVISDLNQMIVQIESTLPVIKEHDFESVNTGSKGYAIETYTPEEERLYGEELEVSSYGCFIKNLLKEQGEYQSIHMSLDELKAVLSCAVEDGLACIDITDKSIYDFVHRVNQKNDPLAQSAQPASAELG